MEAVTSFLSQHWQVILAAVIAIIGGGLVLRWRTHRQSGSSSYADQSNATAGGDVVGRDKVTRIKD
jgi:hypothetical protein